MGGTSLVYRHFPNRFFQNTIEERNSSAQGSPQNNFGDEGAQEVGRNHGFPDTHKRDTHR